MDEAARERKIAHDRERARRYREQLKNDPARLAIAGERARIAARVRYEKLKNDPIRFARFRERHRLAEAKRRKASPRTPTDAQRTASAAATRRWRERLKQDPVQLEAFVERRRIAARQRYVANRDKLIAQQRSTPVSIGPRYMRAIGSMRNETARRSLPNNMRPMFEILKRIVHGTTNAHERSTPRTLRRSTIT